ncbi:MAG: DUF998 domain-containing protein [Promethearchaeota archaeon]|jgi:hypothetical membrane protein
MVAIKESRMEVLFGFFGALFILIMLIITILLTPGYNPLTDTISMLGNSPAKSLFSIGFVVAGSLLIPFYIYLKNELVYLKNRLRKIATGVAIFSNMCIALVGILPPGEPYTAAFMGFHGFVAGVSFIGSCVYIVLYSILMYLGPQSTMYKGPAFKKYLSYYGFCIGVLFVVWLTNPINPLLEWPLAIFMLVWILITAVQSLSFKFSKIPGVYYKRAQYPEALKLFEDAIQVLNNLEMGDEPITETLKDNIEYIKSEMKKDTTQPN